MIKKFTQTLKPEESSTLNNDEICSKLKSMQIESMIQEMNLKREEFLTEDDELYDNLCMRYDIFKEESSKCENLTKEELGKQLNIPDFETRQLTHDQLCERVMVQNEESIIAETTDHNDDVQTDGTNPGIVDCIAELVSGHKDFDVVMQKYSMGMIKCMNTFNNGGSHMTRVVNTLKGEAERLPTQKPGMYIRFIEQLAQINSEGLTTIPVPPNTCYIIKNDFNQHIFVMFKEVRVASSTLREEDALDEINKVLELTALNNVFGQDSTVDFAASSTYYHPFIDTDVKPLDYSAPNVLRTEKAVCFCFDTEMYHGVRVTKPCTDVIEFLRYFGDVKTIKQTIFDVSKHSDYRSLRQKAIAKLEDNGDTVSEEAISASVEEQRKRIQSVLTKVNKRMVNTNRIYSVKDFYFRLQKWCSWYVETEQQKDEDTYFSLEYALTLREKVETDSTRELYVKTQTKKNEYIFTKDNLMKYEFHMYRSLQKSEPKTTKKSLRSTIGLSVAKEASAFYFRISILVLKLVTNYYRKMLRTATSAFHSGDAWSIYNIGIWDMCTNFALFIFGLFIMATNCEWKEDKTEAETIETYIKSKSKKSFHSNVELVIISDSKTAGIKSKNDKDSNVLNTTFDFLKQKYKSLFMMDDDNVCTYNNHLGEVRNKLFMNIINQLVVGFSNSEDLKYYLVSSLNLYDSFIPYSPKVACVVNQSLMDIKKLQYKSQFQNHSSLSWIPLCLELGGDYCQTSAFSQYYNTKSALENENKKIKVKFSKNEILGRAFESGLYRFGFSHKDILEQCAFILDMIYEYTKIYDEFSFKLPNQLQVVKQQFLRMFDLKKYTLLIKSTRYFQKIIARFPIQKMTSAGKEVMSTILSLGSLDEQLVMLKGKIQDMSDFDGQLMKDILEQYDQETKKLIYQAGSSLNYFEIDKKLDYFEIAPKIESAYEYALEVYKTNLQNLYNDTLFDWVSVENDSIWEHIRNNFVTYYMQLSNERKSQMRGFSYCFCSPSLSSKYKYNIFSILDVKLAELKRITPMGTMMNNAWKMLNKMMTKAASMVSGCGNDDSTYSKMAKIGRALSNFRYSSTRFLIYSITRQDWVWADTQNSTYALFGVPFETRKFPSTNYNPETIAQIVAVPTSEISTSVIKEQIAKAINENNTALKYSTEFNQMYDAKFLSVEFDTLFRDETIIPRAYALVGGKYVSDLENIELVPKLSMLKQGTQPSLIEMIMFIPFIFSALEYVSNTISTLYVATYINIFLPDKTEKDHTIYSKMINASGKSADIETEKLMEYLSEFINMFTTLEGILFVFRYVQLLAHPVFINMTFQMKLKQISPTPTNGAFLLVQPYTKSTKVQFSNIPHQFQSGFGWIQKAINVINRRYSKSAPRIAFKQSDVDKKVIISANKETIYFENSDQVFYIHAWGTQVDLNDNEISEDEITEVTEEHNGVVQLKSGSWFKNPHVVLTYEDVIATRQMVKPIQREKDDDKAENENIFARFFKGEKDAFETITEEYVTTDTKELKRHIATINKTMTVDGNVSNIQTSMTPLPRIVIEMLEREVPFNPSGYSTHFQKVISQKDGYYENSMTYTHTKDSKIEQDLTLETEEIELYAMKNHYTSEGIVFTEKAIESGYTNALEVDQLIEWWIVHEILYVKHINTGATYICEPIANFAKSTRQITHVLENDKRVFKVQKNAEFIEFSSGSTQLYFKNKVDLNEQLKTQIEKFERFKSSDIITTVNSDGFVEQIPIQMLRIYDEEFFKEDMHLFGILRLLEHQEHRCKLIKQYNRYCTALSAVKTGLTFIKTVSYSILSIQEGFNRMLAKTVVKSGEEMLEKFGTKQMFYTLPNGDLISPEEYINYPNAIALNIGQIDPVYGTPDIQISNLFNTFAPSKTLFVNQSEFQGLTAAVLTSLNSMTTSVGNAVKCATTTKCRNNALKNIFEQYNAIVGSVSYYLGTDKSKISIRSDIMRRLEM